MSSDPFAGAGAGADPSEEELRAAYEAELDRMTSTDMIAQAAVTLLNIAARRLAPAPGADEGPGGTAARAQELEQVRDAIDAVRALLDIVERRVPAAQLRPLREALSQMQLGYAREVSAAPAGAAGAGAEGAAGEGGAAGGGGGGGGAAGDADQGGAGAGGDSGEGAGAGGGAQGQEGRPRGPAESSGRLWVPGQ